MGTVAHPHQDRSHFKPASLHFQDVAHAGCCICVRKDQNVRGPLHPVGGELPRTQFRTKRRIDVHLTFVTEIVTLRRSEERRVGKECRFRWSPHYSKKTTYNTYV